MSFYSRFIKSLPLLALPVLFSMATGNVKADPVTITSKVSASGSNWVYGVGITNNTSTDPYGELVSVDFLVPANTLVGNPVAPTGNEGVSDPVGGVVEFTSDNLTGFVVGATVNGFQFTDSLKMTSLSFTANWLNHAETMATTFSGTASPASVPEPGTLGLFAGASILLFSKLRSWQRK